MNIYLFIGNLGMRFISLVIFSGITPVLSHVLYKKFIEKLSFISELYLSIKK